MSDVEPAPKTQLGLLVAYNRSRSSPVRAWMSDSSVRHCRTFDCSTNAHVVAFAKITERSMGALRPEQTADARKMASQNRTHAW